MDTTAITKKHHSGQEKTKFHCPHGCVDTFSTPGNLRKHLRQQHQSPVKTIAEELVVRDGPAECENATGRQTTDSNAPDDEFTEGSRTCLVVDRTPELEAMIAELETRIENEEKRANTMESENMKWKENIQDLEEQLKEEGTVRQKLQLDSDQLKEKIKVCEGDLITISVQNQNLLQEKSNLEQRTNDLSQTLDEEKKLVKDLSNLKAEHEQTIAELNQRLSKAQQERQESDRSKQKIETEVVELREELNDRCAQIKMLEMQLSEREKELKQRELEALKEAGGCKRRSSMEAISDLQQELNKKRRKLSTKEKLQSQKSTDIEIICLSSDSEPKIEATAGVQMPVEKTKRLPKVMLRNDQLAVSTKYAQREEIERIKRLKAKQIRVSQINPSQQIERNEGILDFDSNEKRSIIVHKEIIKHLKPHQLEGIKFMYDCCYGNVDFVEQNGGSGCLLAHHMGLGKSLQVLYVVFSQCHNLIICARNSNVKERNAFYVV